MKEMQIIFWRANCPRISDQFSSPLISAAPQLAVLVFAPPRHPSCLLNTQFIPSPYSNANWS